MNDITYYELDNLEDWELEAYEKWLKERVPDDEY
jgi:hypothetical protein